MKAAAPNAPATEKTSAVPHMQPNATQTDMQCKSDKLLTFMDILAGSLQQVHLAAAAAASAAAVVVVPLMWAAQHVRQQTHAAGHTVCEHYCCWLTHDSKLPAVHTCWGHLGQKMLQRGMSSSVENYQAPNLRMSAWKGHVTAVCSINGVRPCAARLTLSSSTQRN